MYVNLNVMQWRKIVYGDIILFIYNVYILYYILLNIKFKVLYHGLLRKNLCVCVHSVIYILNLEIVYRGADSEEQ